MTSQDEPVSLYYRSPNDIRNETFTRRMRGLDEDEVREYLDLLADQMEAVEWQRRELLAELENLRAEVAEQLGGHHPVSTSAVPESGADEAGVQATAVLRHAQEVADQLLDDANHRAREIITTAQTQGHEVVRQARVTTLDRMQSLYDELDGDFRRLDEALRPSAPDR